MLQINNITSQIGYYLAGFADGEGSLMIVARKRPDYQAGWKISLCFNVAQRESYILSQFKKHLGCGTLRQRPDGVCYYEVNNFNAIIENVIPFFERFNFLSQNKKKQFAIFVKAAKIIQTGEHLTEEGRNKIIALRREINRGGKIRNEF